MAQIDDDTPMTLAEACREVFRDAITPATLKGEAAKGRLVLERIGRKYFVTRNALKEMREQCRVQAKVPASGTSRAVGSRTTEEEIARASAALAYTLENASKRQRPAEVSRSAGSVHCISPAQKG